VAALRSRDPSQNRGSLRIVLPPGDELVDGAGLDLSAPPTLRRTRSASSPQPIGRAADDASDAGPYPRVVHDGPILICFDGSPEAEAAIAAAAVLLAPSVAVVVDVAPLMVDQGWEPQWSDAAFVDRLGVTGARARAQMGAELAQQAGFDAEARVTAAIDTWRGVNDVAREIDAAAIVIGSRGLTGLRAVLEGSVSRQVEAHAHRPVLVVPSAA